MDIIANLYHAVAGDTKTKADPSPMERLPQDMLVHILQSINSLRSLRAAVLASSAMYDAFRTAKTETLACVVSHSRPEEIRSDAVALAVLMSIHEQEHSKISMRLTIDSLINPQRSWTYLPGDLSAPHLLHFHWFVEYFTEKLFKSAMREVHRRGWSATEKLKFRRLSRHETIRIQRALYRFEFFNSFMRLDTMNWSGLLVTPLWRENVPAWGMEEIACIHQLLWQRLRVLDDSIFNIIANTKHSCGHRHPGARKDEGWILSATRAVKNLILSQGLATVYKLVSRPENQSTYQRIRDTLVASLHPDVKHILYMNYPVCSCVTMYQPESLFDDWANPRLPCTLQIDRLRSPQEGTDYPSFGYVRAYRKRTLSLIKAGAMSARESTLYYQPEHANDREWGYCLWDKERMEWWGDTDPIIRQDRQRTQIRMRSRESPRWTTVQLNPGAGGR